MESLVGALRLVSLVEFVEYSLPLGAPIVLVSWVDRSAMTLRCIEEEERQLCCR
jgi:hypothetical protein